jgi:hypothetical protein
VKSAPSRVPHSRTRRTTLTLPADTLQEAQRIARARNVNLSTVVGEVLGEGLQERRSRQRTEEIMERYRKAFDGFSAEELMVLDGIILEPRKR